MTVGFTLPDRNDGEDAIRKEAAAIADYLDSGAIDYFHIRKPDAGPAAIYGLLTALPRRLWPRLVVHSAYSVAATLGIGGIHLSRRNAGEMPPPPGRTPLFTTRSCHSLEEVESPHRPDCLYQTLSPIFDSISKEGYMSRFDTDNPELQNVIRGRDVIALGGVTPEKFSELSAAGFGGAALLGYLWPAEAGYPERIGKIIAAKAVFGDIKTT